MKLENQCEKPAVLCLSLGLGGHVHNFRACYIDMAEAPGAKPATNASQAEAKEPAAAKSSMSNGPAEEMKKEPAAS